MSMDLRFPESRDFVTARRPLEPRQGSKQEDTSRYTCRQHFRTMACAIYAATHLLRTRAVLNLPACQLRFFESAWLESAWHVRITAHVFRHLSTLFDTYFQ